jgi:methionyl-tRNA formyltransferase
MKIIFFGSSKTSAEFLKSLPASVKVEAVVSQPDKPSGRGQNTRPTPVKELALKMGIRVLTPLKLDGPEFVAALKAISADAGVVVSYGRMIPLAALEQFRCGCFNVHFSLLPKYRGAAPMQWALINGERSTGVTTFIIEKGLDTGRIYLSKSVSVDDNDDTGVLEGKLLPLGIAAMNETLAIISTHVNAGMAELVKITEAQGTGASAAPSFTKEDSSIDWSAKASEIHNRIRGMVPWPVAHSSIDGRCLRIFESEIFYNNVAEGLKPGQIAGAEKGRGILVRCGEGTILLLSVQMEGKARMPAWQFWQGARLKIGDTFGK